MTRTTGGAKRSSQLTFRRRLVLVRVLLRAPASAADLIAAVEHELGDEGYPPAAAAALKHDLDALKAEYGCQVRFRRELRAYVLEDLGDLALLDLSEAAMEALAFLDLSFPAGTGLPELTNVRELIDQVARLLPPERQAEHERQRGATRLQWSATSSGQIDSGVLQTVKRAIDERRELSFSYLSSFDQATPRRHRVLPYRLFVRPEGHVYLDATLLEVSPSGGETPHAAIDYRLDRVVPGSAELLPRMLPPQRPRPRRYTLIYDLHPNVARRRDVASYFPETEITYHADGSATVSAQITNLWQARHILLRYGDACVVRAPTELISLFRKTAAGLYHIYGDEG